MMKSKEKEKKRKYFEILMNENLFILGLLNKKYEKIRRWGVGKCIG